jgi:hypothetical protein
MGYARSPLDFIKNLDADYLPQYLPRDGIASPAQIITAAQEGTS